jgi:hypothetical protein
MKADSLREIRESPERRLVEPGFHQLEPVGPWLRQVEGLREQP